MSEIKMSKAVRSQLEDALEAAKNAKGNTLFVLVSPRQAERLYLAIKMADAWLSEDFAEYLLYIGRYKELAEP